MLMLKANVKTDKDARGRVASYTATVGHISASGASRAEAVVAADVAVLEALERLDAGPIIDQLHGRTYIVYPTVDGWYYWLEGFGRAYRCAGAPTKHGAHCKALYHLAQNEWSLSVDDDAYLAELPIETQQALRPWIVWQRRVAALMAQGYTLDQAREMVDGRITAGAAK